MAIKSVNEHVRISDHSLNYVRMSKNIYFQTKAWGRADLICKMTDIVSVLWHFIEVMDAKYSTILIVLTFRPTILHIFP